jgi:hypothetical protein
MKDKKFNQTVVFTSESSEVFRRELIAGKTPDAPLVEQLTPISNEPDEDQKLNPSISSSYQTSNEEAEAEFFNEVLVKPIQDSTDSDSSSRSPVPKPHVNMTSSAQLHAQPSLLRSDVQPPKQKVYDRFKRTIETETLDLFNGNSEDIGTAWMIREKDDVIEHRERLGLDNNEFYKDQFPQVTFMLLIACILGGAIWYFMFSSVPVDSQIKVFPTAQPLE